MGEVIVALDAGTSSLRGVAYEPTGKRRAGASFPYTPEYHPDGRVRQATSNWVDALDEVLSALSDDLTRQKLKPLCVSLTSQRASVIPVDRKGTAAAFALMWHDRSTADECRHIREVFDERELYHTTGLRVDSYFSAPKIVWLRNHDPETFSESAKLLGVQDFIAYLLTGEVVTDHTQASRTLLFDISSRRWDEAILAGLGVSQEKLPELVAPGTAIGNTSAELSARCGFPSGVPVILAGGDQQVAAVGMGVIEPENAAANTGTGSFVVAPLDAPAFHPDLRTLCSCAAVPDMWIAEAGVLTTGTVYRWMSRQLGPAEEPTGGKEMDALLARMNELASEAPMGANGVLVFPHFSGAAAPHWNADARGMIVNLSLSSTRADIARACLEAIAGELAVNLGELSRLCGEIRQVTVAGGLSEFALFDRMQADAFGVPVSVNPTAEASAFGALLSACVTMGIYGDHAAAHRALAKAPGEPIHPNAAAHAHFAEQMGIRMAMHDTLREAGLYRRMRRLAAGDWPKESS